MRDLYVRCEITALHCFVLHNFCVENAAVTEGILVTEPD
jgi:hypothetical protein